MKILQNIFDNEIEGYEFHQYKSPILINHIDINEIKAPNEFSLDKQDYGCFIYYKDA